MSYRDLFKKYNQEGIRYVILRKYDSLPEDTMENSRDVDILIKSNQFETAVRSSKSVGFARKEESAPSRLLLYRMALKKPVKAIQKVATEPRESINKAKKGIKFEYDNPRHESVQLSRDDQLIDLSNNLAYTSPMDETKIPVDPTVTEGMLNRRKKRDCFFVPSEADELAHLVSHCVFDKEGDFPPYYANKCEKFLNSIQSNDGQIILLKQLLDKIFFEAGTLVFDLMVENRYSDIRRELKAYSEY